MLLFLHNYTEQFIANDMWYVIAPLELNHDYEIDQDLPIAEESYPAKSLQDPNRSIWNGQIN